MHTSIDSCKQKHNILQTAVTNDPLQQQGALCSHKC